MKHVGPFNDSVAPSGNDACICHVSSVDPRLSGPFRPADRCQESSTKPVRLRPGLIRRTAVGKPLHVAPRPSAGGYAERNNASAPRIGSYRPGSQ